MNHDLPNLFPLILSSPSAPGEAPNPDSGEASPKNPAPSSLHQEASPEPAVPTPQASPGASLPPEPMALKRPRLRGECLAGPRPCPWISCKWHLCWERRDLKRLILSDCHPSLVAAAIMGMAESCVLDLCDQPSSDRDVGAALKVSHQAVAQACQRGLMKLKAKRLLKRGQDEVCGPEPEPAWRWGSGVSEGSGGGGRS